MENILWEKLFKVAKNFGRPEDMLVVNFMAGKKYKSKEHAENIQNRWNARRQKRNLTRDVSSLGVHKGAKKI